jgi:hypothetical protein
VSQVVAEHANTLTAKNLKVTVVLAPQEIIALSVPDGKPRCIVRVNVAGRTVVADLNAKSVRKAIVAIRTAGVDGVACILQGKLNTDDTLGEAGLSVQLKTKAETPTASKATG